MNGKEFGKKYGNKYRRKIPKWIEMGYLGDATKDPRTGEFSIPDDIPLPFSGHSNITQLPTLWNEILKAASQNCSIFPAMYPKLPEGCLERQITGFVESGVISIQQTENHYQYLELRPNGMRLMRELTETEKKDVWNRVLKKINTGWTLAQAIASFIGALMG